MCLKPIVRCYSRGETKSKGKKFRADNQGMRKKKEKERLHLAVARKKSERKQQLFSLLFFNLLFFFANFFPFLHCFLVFLPFSSSSFPFLVFFLSSSSLRFPSLTFYGAHLLVVFDDFPQKLRVGRLTHHQPNVFLFQSLKKLKIENEKEM